MSALQALKKRTLNATAPIEPSNIKCYLSNFRYYIDMYFYGLKAKTNAINLYDVNQVAYVII